MAPTRRDVLRTAAPLCGLGSLAGCVAENAPSSNGTSQGDGRSTTGTATEPTTRTTAGTGPSTVERTPTERTPTERPPAEPTRPDETTMPEASTAAPTDAMPDRETSRRTGGEDGTVTARVDGVITGEATVAVPRTTVQPIVPVAALHVYRCRSR